MSRTVELDAEKLGETPLAFHLRSTDTGNSAWVAKSLIGYYDEEDGIWTVPEWLAIKEGLI